MAAVAREDDVAAGSRSVISPMMSALADGRAVPAIFPAAQLEEGLLEAPDEVHLP